MLLREVASGFALDGLARVIVVTTCTTVPLLAGALVIPSLVTPVRWLSTLGLAQVRITDLLVGACIGLIMRGVVELLIPTTGSTGMTSALLLSLAIAVLVSPFVEELLFRGVLQRALADGMRQLRLPASAALSVLATLVTFVLAHVTAGTLPANSLISASIVAIGCGVLTATTGRLSGAVSAHVTFNLIGAVLLIG